MAPVKFAIEKRGAQDGQQKDEKEDDQQEVQNVWDRFEQRDDG